jgi:hypothetical protein
VRYRSAEPISPNKRSITEKCPSGTAAVRRAGRRPRRPLIGSNVGQFAAREFGCRFLVLSRYALELGGNLFGRRRTRMAQAVARILDVLIIRVHGPAPDSLRGIRVVAAG